MEDSQDQNKLIEAKKQNIIQESESQNQLENLSIINDNLKQIEKSQQIEQGQNKENSEINEKEEKQITEEIQDKNEIVVVYTRFGYVEVDLKQFKKNQVDDKEEDQIIESLLPQDVLKVVSQLDILDKKPNTKNVKQEKIRLNMINDLFTDSVYKISNEQIDMEQQAIKKKISDLELLKEEYLSRIIQVNILKGGQGYIQRRELKTQITVNVKVFHGQRKTHQFKVFVSDKIQTIIDQLQVLEPQDMIQYYQSRLIYAMGYLRNLSQCLSSTFAEQHIPDGAMLTLVGKKSFTWDLQAKGANINLLNGNLTANKKQEVEYETVLGTIAISQGVHYWEIKIDKFVELDDIIIGVSQKGMDIRSRPFETGKFWGWICTGGRKIYPSQPGGPPVAREYGCCAKIGDTLGVLFEFKNNIGHLSFFKNGSPLGVCFNNIPNGSYFPTACLYYGEVQITLNSSANLEQSISQAK